MKTEFFSCDGSRAESLAANPDDAAFDMDGVDVVSVRRAAAAEECFRFCTMASRRETV